jgi:hypothetical protein
VRILTTEPRVVEVKEDTLVLTACIRHMLVNTGKGFQERTACSYVEVGWILCSHTREGIFVTCGDGRKQPHDDEISEPASMPESVLLNL